MKSVNNVFVGQKPTMLTGKMIGTDLLVVGIIKKKHIIMKKKCSYATYHTKLMTMVKNVTSITNDSS